MARSKRDPAKAVPIEEQPGEEPSSRELRRLNKTFDAQWRDWICEGSATEESECLLLTEMVYLLSDLYARAKAMRLDFLIYLIGMALLEAKRELRARESHRYPMPPAR